MKMLVCGICALTACGDEPAELPPPLAEVPGTLGRLAVNDVSIFAIDAADSSLIEIGLDGTIVGKLPTQGAVSEVVAFGDWVGWIEAEGTGQLVRKRRNAMIESTRTFTPHIVATSEGLFYSDSGLVALWTDGAPQRVATPGADPTLLDGDSSFVYTQEADTSVVRYPRQGDVSEILLPSSMAATVKRGVMAYRTSDGVRLRDLFTGFDRVVGMPPSTYECELAIAGRAVLCGKYRALDGTLDELLRDPVGGYVANGKDVYWVTTENEVSSIRVVDAEAMPN